MLWEPCLSISALTASVGCRVSTVTSLVSLARAVDAGDSAPSFVRFSGDGRLAQSRPVASVPSVNQGFTVQNGGELSSAASNQMGSRVAGIHRFGSCSVEHSNVQSLSSC